MANVSAQDRQRYVERSLASSVIEGFKPDIQFIVLLDRYVSGELSIAEISAIIDTEFGLVGSAPAIPTA